jgi:hypothetical protein
MLTKTIAVVALLAGLATPVLASDRESIPSTATAATAKPGRPPSGCPWTRSPKS